MNSGLALYSMTVFYIVFQVMMVKGNEPYQKLSCLNFHPLEVVLQMSKATHMCYLAQAFASLDV